MTELKTVIDAATGKTEVHEYYTHDEFMERKRERLAELIAMAESATSLAEVAKLYVEYNHVRGCVGPMLVGEGEK